ncbi:MAG TPA: hypothetical protein VMG55_21365 [Stellaceae bacterium]|nr:hypothetical protein [Stellaceae bacterium]
MEKDVARHVARVGFRAMRELTELIPLLKDHCAAQESDTFAKAIALASAHIGEQVINRALSPFPDLESEIEAKIKKYGVIV